MVREEENTLIREKPFVKYEQLIAKAEKEGRISGRFRCIICGMRYNEKPDAEECCKVIL